MKNQRLIVIVVAVLVAAAGVYKFVLAKPEETNAKVDGTVFVLPKEFLVNLEDGRYAKVSVALVLGTDPLAKAGHGTPPEGYGGMEEEAVVRDVVVDALGDESADTLSTTGGREKVKRQLRRELNKATDIDVRDVLFPDVTVQ
ncbi:MAG: flagellar basal body-associated protein FliL [Solirubrobacteraceae bacterium]